MANLNNFNANEHDPNFAVKAMPAGKYLAAIRTSEMKVNKAGTGKYLELVWEVLEGPHKGGKLWSRLNLQNPNPTAVRIAHSELSAICRAVNIMTPKDSAEMHGVACLLEVTCVQQMDGARKPIEGKYSNEIKSYTARSAAQAGGHVVVDSPVGDAKTAPVPATANDDKPW